MKRKKGKDIDKFLSDNFISKSEHEIIVKGSNEIYLSHEKIYENLLNQKDAEILKLKRLINCVKDHPKIKPLTCCYQGDSLELKSQREIREVEMNDLKSKLQMIRKR